MNDGGAIDGVAGDGLNGGLCGGGQGGVRRGAAAPGARAPERVARDVSRSTYLLTYLLVISLRCVVVGTTQRQQHANNGLASKQALEMKH